MKSPCFLRHVFICHVSVHVNALPRLRRTSGERLPGLHRHGWVDHLSHVLSICRGVADTSSCFCDGCRYHWTHEVLAAEDTPVTWSERTPITRWGKPTPPYLSLLFPTWHRRRRPRGASISSNFSEPHVPFPSLARLQGTTGLPHVSGRAGIVTVAAIPVELAATWRATPGCLDAGWCRGSQQDHRSQHKLQICS